MRIVSDYKVNGNQILVEKQSQRWVKNPTVVHAATHLGRTTLYVISRIGAVRGGVLDHWVNIRVISLIGEHNTIRGMDLVLAHSDIARMNLPRCSDGKAFSAEHKL